MPSMDYSSYRDRVVVITGAGGEHGGGVAVQLAKHGAKLALIDIHDLRLDERLEQIKETGLSQSHIYSEVGDMMDMETREKFVANLTQKFGQTIHMLFNVVGTKRIASLERTTEEDLDWCLQGNCKLTFHMIQCCLPYMKNVPGGACIITMGSFSSQRAMPEIVAYSMAKAGLDIMTKCISLEFAKYNIRCNMVSPAALRSQFNYRFGDIFSTEEQMKNYYEMAQKSMPIKGIPFACPEDNVVPYVVFLGSDKAKFINGNITIIDCGYTNAHNTQNNS